MIKWAKDLFPICRSITGNGTRKTLNYFKNINPEFKTIKFSSGKKVFDWLIPLEWNIKDAFFKHENGKKFAEFKKNNLHVVGYSVPIKKTLNKKELIKHIYTQKNQPNVIPYVTSYFKKRWGFCISENQKKKLPKGRYEVLINSSLKIGSLDLIHTILKGKSKQEIFFSSYVCHPSMANNELSGPVILNALMLYIKKKYRKTKFSYRFVLLPETIGSIAYLSKFHKQLKKNVISGFNITCAGDERCYSYVSTPSGSTISDDAVKAAFVGLENTKYYSFLHRGSNERQYCSPGIDLPIATFCRSKEYPEYHTNKDDFKVVTEKGLQGSFNTMKIIIDAFELGLYPKTLVKCEPNLGKRGLYPTLSQKGVYKDTKLRMNLIAYSNGKNNIFQLSKFFNVSLEKVCKEYSLLKSNGIIK